MDSGGLVAKEGRSSNAEPLSVTEISSALKRTVEERFAYVRVRGELSGVKQAASGHLYLSLKDEGARIDGVMWRGYAQRLGFLPEDGLEFQAKFVEACRAAGIRADVIDPKEALRLEPSAHPAMI